MTTKCSRNCGTESYSSVCQSCRKYLVPQFSPSIISARQILCDAVTTKCLLSTCHLFRQHSQSQTLNSSKQNAGVNKTSSNDITAEFNCFISLQSNTYWSSTSDYITIISLYVNLFSILAATYHWCGNGEIIVTVIAMTMSNQCFAADILSRMHA